jgi:hypothetical protein
MIQRPSSILSGNGMGSHPIKYAQNLGLMEVTEMPNHLYLGIHSKEEIGWMNQTYHA